MCYFFIDEQINDDDYDDDDDDDDDTSSRIRFQTTTSTLPLMALNSLYCADVLLRSYSLTHSLTYVALAGHRSLPPLPLLPLTARREGEGSEEVAHSLHQN